MSLTPDAEMREPCELLRWDSEFWGFPIARVRGDTMTPERLLAVDQWCQERNIACLYFLATFADGATVRCAEEGQYHLVDARVTFARTAQRFSATPTSSPAGVGLRSAVERDVESLRQIAGQSHRDSRFFFDQHFPRAKCQQLYERWIVESCHGFAEQVLVAEISGLAVGYTTCHLPQRDAQPGSIGLVGVAPAARGRGAGQALVYRALGWFAAQQVTRVNVATQGRNIGAQVLYQRCGFISQSHQLWYHKWFHPPHAGSS